VSYLNQSGIVTVLVVAQHGIVGAHMSLPVDVSYVADTVMLLPYFEAEGRVHKAISAIKKRTGAHETAIRAYRLSEHGISIGAPLEGFQGILTGVPSSLRQAPNPNEGPLRVQQAG
ncbi:MAG: P-loop NTPase family protein, partial [Deltaproteobacteria bacterium]